MRANEVVLITLLQNFKTKYQRAIILEKYIQKYGALSQEAGEIIKGLLDEVK